MDFLDYLGKYDELRKYEYNFKFKDNITKSSAPCFIPSPTYDIPFKKFFLITT